ncbi:hypothetical protein B0J14DRAFT_652161 [Halenospora varia]|nr:hypothetical protein B0J14DRAFT_652161 [Halenospora varia]
MAPSPSPKTLWTGLRFGGNLDDCYNLTTLSVAARMGHGDIVALLLTRSSGLNIKDNFGRTPLWWARRTGHPDIADLLLKKYKENGTIVQEDDSPTATISVLAEKDSRYCEVRVLSISDKDIYYIPREWYQKKSKTAKN